MDATTSRREPESLSCTGLSVSAGGRELVAGLNMAIQPGDFVCILGPNGVGKTLTLHTLAGLRAPARGQVKLGNDVIDSLDRPAIARRLGLLLQEQEDAFPVTVLETALLGRHARLAFWQWETDADRTVAGAALAAMDLAGLEQRPTATLSGGERRRLALATLLVQDPALLLLDEPMNHLDPAHRFVVLEKLATLCASGRGILASLHDPALAARYATAVLLLHGDGRWDFGAARELLTPERLGELYGTPFAVFHSGNDQVIIPVPPDPRA